MAKLSKRTQALRAKIDRNRNYALDEAIGLIRETATARFDESVSSSPRRTPCASSVRSARSWARAV